MALQNLNPGERVVELAAVVRSAALVTGAVSAAWLTISGKRGWLPASGALLVGATIGFFIAQLISRLLYQTADGQTTVVRAGGGALPATISAGLLGAISTSVVVAMLALVLFWRDINIVSVFAICLGCGAVLGVLFACLASLL